MTNILYKFRAFIDTKMFGNEKPQKEYTLLGTITILAFFPFVIATAIIFAILIGIFDLAEYLDEYKITPKKEQEKKQQ